MFYIESVASEVLNKPMATIMVRDVDPDLRKRFRLVCLHNEISMNRAIRDMIAQYVEVEEAKIERERGKK